MVQIEAQQIVLGSGQCLFGFGELLGEELACNYRRSGAVRAVGRQSSLYLSVIASAVCGLSA